MIIALEDTRQENLINLTRSKSVIIAIFVAGLLLGELVDPGAIVGNLRNIKSGLKGVDVVRQQEADYLFPNIPLVATRNASRRKIIWDFLEPICSITA